jgi:hypothetical protein
VKLRTLEEQIGGKCSHFNGLMNDKCRAGIAYNSVEGERVPYRKGLPCFREGEANTRCEKRHFLTPEEVAAKCADARRGFDNVKNARAAIVAHIAETKQQNGACKCPICGEKLYYNRAQCNGHIHARCETKDCVCWME